MSEENVEVVPQFLATFIEVDEGRVEPERLREFGRPDAPFCPEKILDAGADRVVVTFHQRGKLRSIDDWVEMRYGAGLRE